MKLRYLVILGALLILPVLTFAQTLPEVNYSLGRVLEVLDTSSTVDELTGQTLPTQEIKVELDTTEVQVIKYGGNVALQQEQLLEAGDRVVILQQTMGDQTVYSIVDQYRLPWLWVSLGIFAVCIIALIQWRGVGALAGVAISLLVLVKWLVPQLLHTQYPLVITFVTLLALAVVTFYLGHGVNEQTTLALVCTVACLLLALGVTTGLAAVMDLTGSGSEAALSLKYGFGQDVQLRGLLLAGLLLGALGVLDDVTMAQVQAVHELKEADPGMGWRTLFFKGFRIGKAHIAALVNTLVLAYAGAALPAFLLLTNFGLQPLWVSLNSETIMEEIIQMFVGSFTLVLAVPLTTLAAAWWDTRRHQ